MLLLRRPVDRHRHHVFVVLIHLLSLDARVCVVVERRLKVWRHRRLCRSICTPSSRVRSCRRVPTHTALAVPDGQKACYHSKNGHHCDVGVDHRSGRITCSRIEKDTNEIVRDGVHFDAQLITHRSLIQCIDQSRSSCVLAALLSLELR